jgi:hypothetical protein
LGGIAEGLLVIAVPWDGNFNTGAWRSSLVVNGAAGSAAAEDILVWHCSDACTIVDWLAFADDRSMDRWLLHVWSAQHDRHGSHQAFPHSSWI